MTKKSPDMVTLKIPRPLYERLQQLIEGTGFRSVTEFATYILRDLASRPSAPADDSPPAASDGSTMSDAELKAIVARLRDLGYL